MRLRDVIVNVIVDVIIFLKTSATVPYHIDLALSKSVVREGERLKATCNVTTNDTKRNYQVVWFKILPDSSDDEVEIATNMFVNEEFRRSKRYEAGFELTTPDDVSNVRFFLEISNVQSGDSGYIGCRIDMPPIMPVERFRLFTVQVPVESVWWSSSSPDDVTDPLPVNYDTTANVSLTEGETRQLSCHCHGAYPRPDIDVHMGSEDITHQFTRSDELVKVDGSAGLHPIYYDVELSSRRMTVEYRFDGLALKCRARLPGIQDNRAAVLHVRISEYKPKFFCVRQMLTRIGEVNFNVTCRVKAEPEVSNATIFRNDHPIFDSNFSAASAVSSLNASNDHLLLLRSYVETISESEILMTLWIGKVSPKHLGSYIFEAENDLGVERHKLELHQELSAELHSMYVGSGGPSSAADAMRSNQRPPFTLTTALIVAIFAAAALTTPPHTPHTLHPADDEDDDEDAASTAAADGGVGDCLCGMARGLADDATSRRRRRRRRRTAWKREEGL